MIVEHVDGNPVPIGGNKSFESEKLAHGPFGKFPEGHSRINFQGRKVAEFALCHFKRKHVIAKLSETVVSDRQSNTGAIFENGHYDRANITAETFSTASSRLSLMIW